MHPKTPNTLAAFLFTIAAFLIVSFARPAVAAPADDTSTAVPVPDAAAQEKAFRIVKDLFKDEIDAAKNPATKLELAKTLMQRGMDTQGDPAGQYVLLRQARDYAIAAADPGLALQVVDEIIRGFQVDSLALRLETLVALSKIALVPAQAKTFAESAAVAADEALTADNFEIAKQAMALGVAAAKKTREADLNKQMVLHAKEIDALEESYRGVKKAMALLDEKPADPAANLAVGRYRVLTKGDWDRGVPMLALGSDAKLKELAVKELDLAADSSDDMVKLADAWADYSASLDGPGKDRVEARSLYWYAKALPNLSGLPRVRIEKILQDYSSKLYFRIQAALKSRKTSISRPAGSNRGNGFFDVLEEGGLLIGLEVGTIDIGGGERIIRSIRPIYRSARGESPGVNHGQGRGDTTILKAKDGFAVGSVTVKTAAGHVVAVTITFMQTEGLGLNSRNSYNSLWAGGEGMGQEIKLGGTGSPVVGIAGRIATANNGATALEALSIVTLK